MLSSRADCPLTIANPSPFEEIVTKSETRCPRGAVVSFTGTSLTLLTIAIAFPRFYNEEDFRFLGYLAQPRIWSNRLTVAALVVAVVNFCVEWNLRNNLSSG